MKERVFPVKIAIATLKETLEGVLGARILRSRGFPFVRFRRRFLTVRMDLSNKCNLRCKMCYFALDEVWKAPRKVMSDAVIGRLEHEVWPHTQELWLSCASEPLINDNLASVLSNAVKAGIPKIGIITNGLALDEERARMLISCGLTDLCVSIDGATKETYEDIRHLSNFGKVIENVRRLQELKRALGSKAPRLQVIAVIMLRNLPELPSIVDLAADLGAAGVLFRGQTYYAEFGETRRICDVPDEVNAALDRARATANRRGIELIIPGEFGGQNAPIPRTCSNENDPIGNSKQTVCYYAWDQIIVYCNGEVVPCSTLFGKSSFGNLETDSFQRIFWGGEFRAMRDRIRRGDLPAMCRRCPSMQSLDLGNATFEDAVIRPSTPMG